MSAIAAFLFMSLVQANAQPPAIDVSKAKQYFEEAQVLAKGDDGKLWGQSLEGPLLFADRKTRQVVANQRDAEGLLKAVDEVFTGQLPAGVNVANTSVTWAGVKWTMVMWPLPKDQSERGSLLMHESWHRIQDQLGFPTTGPDNKHLDMLDGRLWLQLEWRALAAALAAQGTARQKAIEDALLFRAYRHQVFKNVPSLERALEMHEGLAEYTGIRLCGLAERELPAIVIKKLEQRPAEMATFVRSFAYLSGPAYGLLLDASGVDWRKGLKPSDDFGALLQRAMALELGKPDKADVEARAKRYQGEKLQAAEQAREDERQKRLANNRARFLEGPVLVVPLRQIQISFDPGELQPLDELGTVYPALRLSDTWGVLTVTKGALLWADFSKVHLVAPKDVSARPLEGDGWKLELKEGWIIEPGKRQGDFVLSQSKK